MVKHNIPPENWKNCELRSCAEKPSYGANASSVDFDPKLHRYIRITDIDEQGRLKETSKKSIPYNAAGKSFLKKGDIVFARTGATVRKTYLHDLDLDNYVYAGYLIKFTPKTSLIIPQYLFYFTQSYRYSNWVRDTIRSGAQPNINSEEYSSLIIPLPPLDEQASIISVISTWDKAIEQLTQLIEAKCQRKKSLMQRLLTGKLRLPEFSGQEWIEIELSKCLIPTFRETDKPKNNYLAIGIRSHCKGTFQKPDSDPEKIAMDKLYIVKENDLIVNITFAWEGAIALAKQEDDGGYVSHRFPTHTFNEELAIAEYFKYVVTTKRFRFILDLISPGDAGRNRVLSKKEFLKIKWPLPSVGEQTRIASILSSADAEINQLEEKLERYKKQKKELMQQLLTGKKRVNLKNKEAA